MAGKQKKNKTRPWEQDLQKLEAAYKDSEKKYQELINNLPLGVFEYNLEGKVVFSNPYGMEMMGYTQKDVDDGISIYDIAHPDSHELATIRYQELMRGKAVGADEYLVRMKNGNTFTVLLYSYPIFADDDVVGVRGVAFDLTKSKKIEKQLQELLTRYEAILNSMPDIIFRFDKQGHFLDFHTNSPNKLLVQPEKFMGRDILEVPLPEELALNAKTKITEAISTGTIAILEYNVDGPDGLIYFEARFIPIGKEEVQVIIRDITEMVTAQNTIQQIEAEKAVVLDSMTEMFAYFTPEMKIKWVNKAYASKIGKQQEDLIGKKCHELWHNIEHHCPQCPVALASRTGEPQHGEVETPDGRIWNIRGYPIFNKKGELTGLSEFCEDITERKLNEEGLKDAKERAEQANKTKSEFISNISHEIRTPLNSIIGFSEMLTSHLEDPKLKEYAGSIRSAGDSLLMLINDILDLSKIEAGRLEVILEPVEIRAVIKEISQVFAVKVARKNLDFVVDVQDEVPESLKMDKIRIRQVLFNLIGNAVKFTNKGFIRLIVEKIDPETEESKPGLYIRVEDSGVGIHEDAHEAIFDSFVQLGNQVVGQSTEGTGLGLAITRRLVEMMGGSISVESSPGQGSSFIIKLNEVEVARNTTVRSAGTDFSTEIFIGKKVLLVDDSEINRMFVKDNLVEEGVVVKEAENGAEALEWVEAFKPDLILLDIMMPVMDGYEAMLKLRVNKNTSSVPVLALTALAMKEDIDRIRASGFDDYLIKPFHIEELYEKMKALLEGSGEGKTKPGVMVKDVTSDRIYLESLREAITRIDKHYLPLWQQANELKEYKSIRIFADAIHAIGQELDIKLLVDYGDKLVLFCDNYDIEKIDISLADFPEYLKKMKEIVTNDE